MAVGGAGAGPPSVSPRGDTSSIRLLAPLILSHPRVGDAHQADAGPAVASLLEVPVAAWASSSQRPVPPRRQQWSCCSSRSHQPYPTAMSRIKSGCCSHQRARPKGWERACSGAMQLRRGLPLTPAPRSATNSFQQLRSLKRKNPEITTKLFPWKERVGRICSVYFSRPWGQGGVRERALWGELLAATVDVHGFKELVWLCPGTRSCLLLEGCKFSGWTPAEGRLVQSRCAPRWRGGWSVPACSPAPGNVGLSWCEGPSMWGRGQWRTPGHHGQGACMPPCLSLPGPPGSWCRCGRWSSLGELGHARG